MFFKTQRAQLLWQPFAVLWASGMRAVGRSSQDPGGAGNGPGHVCATEQDFVSQAVLLSPSLHSF